MAAADPKLTYLPTCAPKHILVDEKHVDEVRALVESDEFPTDDVRPPFVTRDRNAKKVPIGALGGVKVDKPDRAGLVALSWTNTADPEVVVDRLRQMKNGWFDFVAPDHVVGVVVDPDTGEVATSPEMGGPGVKKAKATTRFFPARTKDDVIGSGVTVGVVDSGIRRHPWYEGSILAAPGSIDPLDNNRDGQLDRQAGHGTFVSGLILQQAPGATVRVARAFDDAGYVLVRQAANAIVELDQRGADIINLSFGGYTRNNRMPLAHRKAFSKLREGTVVVAAAGNHDPDNEKHEKMMGRAFWPAAMKRVVAVAALDQVKNGKIQRAPFSNYGEWVELSAVGTNLLSTFVRDFENFNGWALWSGTSFAAPVVAGRIAAAMTDEDGNIVRTAMEAKERVIEEATQAAKLAGLFSDGSGLGPVIPSVKRKA